MIRKLTANQRSPICFSTKHEPNLSKKVSAIFFFLLAFAGLQGQVVPSWVNGFGSTGNDTGNDIAIDGSGNRYVIGQFLNTVDFDPGMGTNNLVSAGAADIYVLKLSSAGALVWAVRFGGTGTDVGTSIAVDNAMNVYFTAYGSSIDFGGGTLTATGVDGYVCKLNASGNYVWAVALGGAGNQRARGVAVDPMGANVYVTGEFTNSVNTFSFTAGQQNDAFTARLSGVNGATVWARQWQGAIGMTNTGQQYGQGIAVDGSGNVLTVGRFEGTVNFNPAGTAFNLTSFGNEDVFVSKLDASGMNVWAAQFGGTDDDSGYDITVDPSNDVYTTGGFRGTADFDPGIGVQNLVSQGVTDVFISKISSAGVFQWVNSLGGSTGDLGQAISYNAMTNEVGVAGHFSGVIDCSVTSRGANDAFISILSSAGVPVITASVGGTAFEAGNGIANDGSTFTITGSFGSTPADFDPTSGTVNLSSTGSNDIYVADYTYSALSVCDLMISNVASTDETFAGNNDGTITITASCTSCTSIQYSIDNGMNFSPMSSFTGLTPGMYHVLARDSGDPCCIQDGGDITILTGPTCIDPQGTLSVDLNQICPGGQVNLVFTATAGQEPFALTVNGTVYMNVMSGVPFATLVEGVDFNGDTDFTLTQIMESMGCISNVPQTVSVVVSALSQSNLSCRNLNISVLADGSAAFNLDELVTYGACSAPLNLKITSPSGAIVLNATALTPGSDVIIANACSFGQQQLAVTVSYASGLSCESKISFKQGIPPTIPGRSKDIYCFDALAESGNIDGKTPSVQVPCGPEISMTFVADWLKDYECTTATNANTPESDTAKVIYREYEVFYKDARYVTFDTLVVFRLPAIIAGFSGENTYCAENDTVYCGEGFAGPFMIIPERCDPALFGQDQDGDGVPCDTIYFLSYDTAAGKWVTNDLPAKCGLTMHLDQWAFGDACNRQYKLTLELKQNCYGRETGSICGMATADNAFEYVSPNPFTGLGEPLYLRCEFWVTDLDTVPPLAICKGDPFFGPWRGIDKWTFNTIRDFDFLHEEDFLGGLVAGLPSFDDIVIPDELTMLDTSRAPYSMCYESEKIIENPDIYLGLNTGFMVAESDMEFTFDWDFLLGEFDAQNSIVGVPGAIGLIGYGINGTFYKLVEGVEEPLLDQFAPYQAFLDGVMGELEVDHELCNLNISLFLEDSWGSTTIRLKEGDVLTLFGIWVSNSDAKIQFSGENLISTNTHECSAHAYVPPLIVKEDWSGVKQVKASIEGIGTVILSYDVTQRCYVSHEQLKLPYREDPYQVVYEVYDSCHNVGYEYCYLKVKDRTRPVAVSDKGVTVSLSDKKVWVDATVFDEGSYDNCGVNLLLARRKDWNEACVDLCYNVSPEAACDPKSQTDYESAVIPIWTDGHDTLWCLELEDDKHCDPVEAHYAKQMQWFCEDDLPCGELLYNGWVYDLIKYATLNCRENHYLDNTAFHALIEKALKYPDADPNDSLDYLIEGKFKCSPSRANAECILPFTFGRFPLLEFLLAGPSIPIQMMTAMSTMQTMYLPVEHSFCGYNDAELNYHLDRWSQIGGGWSDAVPFSCEDACGPVTVEILVMDYWCNWNKAWTNVWVEDKTPITVAKDVVDGTITCKVYKDNDYTYPGEEHPVSIEYIIEQAKNGEQDAYAALDGIFGGYCKAWVDPYGNFVDIDGYEIDCDIPFYDSVCYCTSYYEQVQVYDDHLGYLWVDSLVTHCYYEPDTLNFQKGIVAVNCAENVHCEQEVWCDFDHCGQGYIYRKFKIWSSCAEAPADSAAHIPDTIYRHQKIYVGNECELNKYMFDVPGDVEVFSCNIEYGPDGNVVGVAGPENTGYAEYLFDDDCRIVGIAHQDKVFKIVGGDAACYKILRTWYFADWCNYGGDVASGSWWLDPGIVVDKCVQKIIVTDTVPPVCLITGPVESGDTVTLGACEYTLDVDVDAMDECGLINYYWELKDITDAADHLLIDSGSDALGGGAEESFSLSIEGLLPGTYKLKVEVQDECTNESYCEYVITVASGKKPTPVCITSLTARLTPWDSDGDGEVDSAHAVVWTYEFDRSSTPACGDDSLAYRIEFLDGTEDDETAAGDLDYLDLGCADIGSKIVRMWVISLPSDTRDYCDAVLVVQSDGSGCPGTQGSGGDVMTYEGDMAHTTPDRGVRSGDLNGAVVVSGDAGFGSSHFENGYLLEQNRPNPFQHETSIGFVLPESMPASLEVYDLTGRLIKAVDGSYVKGYNTIRIEKKDLNVSGVLYYRLRAGDYVVTKKMIVIE